MVTIVIIVTIVQIDPSDVGKNIHDTYWCQVCKVEHIWQTTSKRIWDLWSNDLIRLEHVDGEGLPFDYHKHHVFLFPLVHVRRVGSQIAHSEDDNVNSVALGTSSEAGGTKADQEERKAIIKNMENHRKPWL